MESRHFLWTLTVKTQSFFFYGHQKGLVIHQSWWLKKKATFERIKMDHWSSHQDPTGPQCKTGCSISILVINSPPFFLYSRFYTQFFFCWVHSIPHVCEVFSYKSFLSLLFIKWCLRFYRHMFTLRFPLQYPSLFILPVSHLLGFVSNRDFPLFYFIIARALCVPIHFVCLSNY